MVADAAADGGEEVRLLDDGAGAREVADEQVPDEAGDVDGDGAAALGLAVLLEEDAEFARLLLALLVAQHLEPDEQVDVAGGMAALMKEAVKPNLLQTLEGTPALIHAGPFGNVATGTSSIIADRLGLQIADAVVTEAGFGSDLGGEKFFNLKCRASGLAPDVAVLVATVRGLKALSPGIKIVPGKPLDPALLSENLEALEEGTVRESGSRFFGISPSVVWPVFRGGSIRANIEVQNALQEQALAAYEQAVLDGFLVD